MSDTAIKANEDRVVLGMGLMLAAYLAFSGIDVTAKWLALAGIPALQLAFMRYVGHFVISMGIMGSGSTRFATPHLWLVILRGGLLCASTILNFIALRYLPLTLTSTILFSAPIIICALSWPLLGERVGVWRWLAIFVGFGGILISIRPFGDEVHWAVILSLSGAFCFAMYSILTRYLAGKVSTNSMQLYSGAVGTFVLLPFAIWQWTNPDTVANWIIMFGMGFFGWFGHQLLTNAHRFAEASTLTPFGYSFIIYLAVWSVLLFDHVPDAWNVVGAIIVVFAGLFIWARERRLHALRLG
ncbi:MAG: DMT family transporter [Pseudomonadota bacterium]